VLSISWVDCVVWLWGGMRASWQVCRHSALRSLGSCVYEQAGLPYGWVAGCGLCAGALAAVP
jgi:hypothetical protein